MLEKLMLPLAAALTTRAPFVGRWLFIVYRCFVPRFTVGALATIFDSKGRVLLVEHRFHPQHPWGLPGGVIQADENPDDAAIREVREELGLNVQVVATISVQKSRLYRRHLTVFVLAKPEVPALANDALDNDQLSLELKQYQWCALDQLPGSVDPNVVAAIKAAWTIQHQFIISN